MASLKKRGNSYYAQYYLNGKQKRLNLDTSSLQVAKEKVRKIESAFYRGDDIPLPTKTPISQVVTDYIEYMRTRKTARSVERDTYYLRETFGPICPALTLKNSKISAKGKKRPTHHAPQYIEAICFEQITTADISSFIATRVRRQSLAPKTANRYREILTRLFNWAMEQNGIRITRDKNPAAKVERYRERAPDISFLSLEEIDQQFIALGNYPDLQVMVAVYIYAGLRREELCWLQESDVDFSAGVHGMIRVRAKTVNGASWEPKTKVNRVVPISSKLKIYLEKYLTSGVEGGWYFSTPKGKRWDPDNLSRYLRKANEEASLEWNCLDFRHTFGSQLAMKGESLYKISNLMGNSPEICRRHYAALIPDSLIETVEF
jgi:integrase